MTKKSKTKTTIFLAIFMFILLSQFTKAAFDLGYDIDESMHELKYNTSNNILLAKIILPKDADYIVSNNSFFSNETLLGEEITEDNLILKFFDFNKKELPNKEIIIKLNPHNTQDVEIISYNLTDKFTEETRVYRKEVKPLYLYLYNKESYDKIENNESQILNITAGIPYLVNLYKRSYSIDEIANLSLKIKINNETYYDPFNYIEINDNYFTNEEIANFTKYIRESEDRFFIEKIESSKCGEIIPYTFEFDLQSFKTNFRVNAPHLNEIYDIVDIFFDTESQEVFDRVYLLVDIFFECDLDE